jgi:pimeloyl-ACP methyl ester carboxylesterase
VLTPIGVIVLVLTAGRWQAAHREALPAAKLAPTTGKYVAAADVQMFVQDAGPADAVPVLFVHGTGAWSETWRDTLSALTAAGYRVIAIDLPPFGFSERPQNRRYDKRSQGARIVGALDSLGIHDAILVGHSFGGGPTVEAALLAPSRVRALVLVDAALGIRESSLEQAAAPPPFAMRFLLDTQPLRNAVVGTFFSNPLFTQRILRSFIADGSKATDERVAIYQRPLVVEGTTQAFGEWLPALILPGAARSEDPAAYATLKMPVGLLWGDLDTITPLPQGRRLASLVPGAQLEILGGVGHIPQLESPAVFNDALLRMLARRGGIEAPSSSGEKSPGPGTRSLSAESGFLRARSP